MVVDGRKEILKGKCSMCEEERRRRINKKEGENKKIKR